MPAEASVDDLRAANRAVVEAQSFIHVIRVRDGRVILQQEYFDSEILAEAERAARAKGRSPLQ